MSIIYCHIHDEYVDTDYDAEHFDTCEHKTTLEVAEIYDGESGDDLVEICEGCDAEVS